MGMHWLNRMGGPFGRPDNGPGEDRLRLVGARPRSTRGQDAPQSGSSTAPIQHHADPRWVLAVRTAEALQGAILPPERRAMLIRTGRVLGLTSFDANMVIALVQDQARRGHRADQCPAASAPQLARINHPDDRRAQRRGVRSARPWQIACWCLALLTLELGLIFLFW